MANDEEFLIKLMITFQIEADEHIASISTGLLELEKEISDARKQEVIEIVFRAAHSLKGAARSVNLVLIESICQTMESLLSLLRKRELAISTYILNSLHDANDFVRNLLIENITELDTKNKLLMELVQENLTKAAKGLKPPVSAKKTAPEESFIPVKPTLETVRIPVSKLETVLTKVEELVNSKLAVKHHIVEINRIKTSLINWQKKIAGSKTLHPEIAKFVNSLTEDLQSVKKSFDEDARFLGCLVDDLRSDMKNILLFPFAYAFEILPKLVRDLAIDQNKEIELIMIGQETEIDKRVLQEIKDPLIHLIRNSIDHGIETPTQRLKLNKSARGTITISVSQIDATNIEITISDDGAGINPKTVKQVAVKQGLLSTEEANSLQDSQIFDLIFETGISTSTKITSISGRGLGMSIVRENVERLGGKCSVKSIIGQGTDFSLILPVTISTFRGILFTVNEQKFIVPTKNVIKICRVPDRDIKSVENRETICFSERAVSLVSLAEILAIPAPNNQQRKDFINVMIVSNGSKHLALIIDDVLNEEEMLLKSLGSQLKRIRNIAGAAILGTGLIVPILNIADVLKCALKINTRINNCSLIASAEDKNKKEQILVVDDSITARSLVTNILESENYTVISAVDGIDALLKLAENHFDLVVSDVQMPRMNGFDLTKRIRSESKYANLPIILVTGLESLEDKKLGIEAGANAYIIKSNFDQNNLIEVVKRLI